MAGKLVCDHVAAFLGQEVAGADFSFAVWVGAFEEEINRLNFEPVRFIKFSAFFHGLDIAGNISQQIFMLLPNLGQQFFVQQRALADSAVGLGDNLRDGVLAGGGWLGEGFAVDCIDDGDHLLSGHEKSTPRTR